MNAEISQAIIEKRIIAFNYRGFRRIAEPHLYGYHEGVDRLLVYQIGGGSTSGNLPKWLTVAIPEMTHLFVLDQMFPGLRPGTARHLSTWEATFAMVP